MESYQSLFMLELMAAANRTAPDADSAVAASASVVEFWRSAGPTRWFAKDPAFDQRFRERFLSLHEAAAQGELDSWQATAEGAFALVLLLDQYPRNSFRGSPRMYATDGKARSIADAAIHVGHDRDVEAALRVFVYLPFAHSEHLADQNRSVELVRPLGPVDLAHAEHHRAIVQRFGRFPHRNAILGRASRPDEERYLANGGYSG